MSAQRYAQKKVNTAKNSEALKNLPTQAQSDKKTKRKASPLKVALGVLFCAVIFCAVAITVTMFWGVKKYNDMVENPQDIPFEQIAPKVKERINCLIIGTEVSGYNTDTLMFVSYDAQENTLKTISIPRDTRVMLQNGRYQKINALQAIGGTELLLRAVNEIIGAPIHYYLKIDLDGFKSIVDMMDGVEFDVPQRMKYSDPYQDLYIDLQPGPQRLNGDQAEQLIRFRRYPLGDITRTEVQQAFINAMITQMISKNNILKLPGLFAQITKYVTTNFSTSDFTYHSASAAAFFDTGEVKNFSLPGKLADISGVSWYLHDPRATLDLFKEEFGGTGESEMEEKYAYTYIYDAKDKAPATVAPTKEPDSAAKDPKEPDGSGEQNGDETVTPHPDEDGEETGTEFLPDPDGDADAPEWLFATANTG